MRHRATRIRVRTHPVEAVAITVILAGFAACEVTNPGPVQDEFLNLREAHAAFVNGAQRKLTEGYGLIAYMGAHRGRELLPSGQGGPGGLTGTAQAGHFVTDSGLAGSGDEAAVWRNNHAARWIAEEAIRRFTTGEAGTVEPNTLAQAYLWAGYANRTLGEHMCVAVFNGGAQDSYMKHLTRADSQFTKAVELGSGNVKTAAYAGRASVRLWTKDWTGAASDAQQVPLAFVHKLVMESPPTETQNPIFAGNDDAPVRAHTINFTWFYTYYQDTGDPRSAWRSDPKRPTGTSQLSGYGPVPWSYSLKYKSRGDGMPLSSGREMVLLRAEVLLQQNQVQPAMDLINQIRTSVISDKTGQKLAPWTAGNAAEAWTALKRERSIEFWLEGRRMGDLRRWEEHKTPGTVDWPDWESLTPFFRNNPPTPCIPVPISETDSNPNFKK